MSSFYTSLAATATRLITSKGQVVTFSREVGGTFNPVTGLTVGATTTPFTANAVALDYKNTEIDGTVIQKGDVRLITEAIATTPEIDDTCTIDSVVYRVLDVRPLSPAAIDLIYTVQLRL